MTSFIYPQTLTSELRRPQPQNQQTPIRVESASVLWIPLLLCINSGCVDKFRLLSGSEMLDPHLNYNY